MAVHLLPKQDMRVRFSYPAQKFSKIFERGSSQSHGLGGPLTAVNLVKFLSEARPNPLDWAARSSKNIINK